MATGTTKIENLIDPQVMADMISAKLPQKIKVCLLYTSYKNTGLKMAAAI